MSKKNSEELQERLTPMISASDVAEIWNRRAQNAGYEGSYTRWSVYQRREVLGGIKTELGYLYERKKAEEINLRFGSPRRPEVADRNRTRKGKKQSSEDIKTDV